MAGPRALYWPQERALLVADLHLEKASWYAAGGQMLPPYDSRETLERLGAVAAAADARRIFCLGDNFHDDAGPTRLEAGAAALLGALAQGRELVWIAGNHDAQMAGGLPGTCAPLLEVAGLALVHEARPFAQGPEISGHFHPALTLEARGRRLRRPCCVASENRLILPAFGALTGTMAAADPAIVAALQPARAIDALVAVAERVARYPLWRG